MSFGQEFKRDHRAVGVIGAKHEDVMNIVTKFPSCDKCSKPLGKGVNRGGWTSKALCSGSGGQEVFIRFHGPKDALSLCKLDLDALVVGWPAPGVDDLQLKDTLVQLSRVYAETKGDPLAIYEIGNDAPSAHDEKKGHPPVEGVPQPCPSHPPANDHPDVLAKVLQEMLHDWTPDPDEPQESQKEEPDKLEEPAKSAHAGDEEKATGNSGIFASDE